MLFAVVLPAILAIRDGMPSAARSEALPQMRVRASVAALKIAEGGLVIICATCHVVSLSNPRSCYRTPGGLTSEKMARLVLLVRPYQWRDSIQNMCPEKMPPPPKAVREYFRELGKYGKLGGQATAKKLTAAQRKHNAKKASDAASGALTPEERKARAKKAAAVRWSKARKKKAAVKGKE